jgi:hypothetical protein
MKLWLKILYIIAALLFLSYFFYQLFEKQVMLVSIFAGILYLLVGLNFFRANRILNLSLFFSIFIKLVPFFGAAFFISLWNSNYFAFRYWLFFSLMSGIFFGMFSILFIIYSFLEIILLILLVTGSIIAVKEKFFVR